MLAANKPPLREAHLEHISMRPWSEYSESDYTPIQWHNSCLIHLHEGAPTNKALCKLPVRTPNGAINKNGVHAATAALHGARGDLDAPEEQKDKARQALIRLYGELGEEPPSSLNHSDDMLAEMGMYTVMGEEYLAHFGVKGMRWGVRNADGTLSDADRQRRNDILIKTAVATGVVAVGVVLLKRGNVKTSSPASKRIAIGGAKAAGRVLNRTGRFVFNTSVKVGKTAGVAAFKGTTKVATLVGKGAYKGTIAVSKATARGLVQSGSKFYTNVVKKSATSSVKLSSHVFQKVAGRGRPVATDVARRTINLSPTDLLLNVRSDSWGGRR